MSEPDVLFQINPRRFEAFVRVSTNTAARWFQINPRRFEAPRGIARRDPGRTVPDQPSEVRSGQFLDEGGSINRVPDQPSEVRSEDWGPVEDGTPRSAELSGTWGKNPEGERTRAFARVTVNGRVNEQLDGFDTELSDDDRVALIDPFVFCL